MKKNEARTIIFLLEFAQTFSLHINTNKLHGIPTHESNDQKKNACSWVGFSIKR